MTTLPVRNKRRTLYVFVEVGSRELLSRLVLADEARRRGYRVILGEKNLLRNLCWLFQAPPGIILDKCGQIANSYPIRALKRRGFVYAVLDEEGIFFAHRNRLPHADDLMLFNSCYQRRLSASKAPEKDIVGNPRLHPKHLLPYLQAELAEVKRQYKEFVLICSSFDPKMQSSYGFQEEAELDRQFREKFLEIISRLANKIPIVYRPHPSDGDDFANQIRALVPVDRRFTILPWIAAAQLVVNAKCTSSFEAVQLGVPSATLALKSMSHAKLNALSRRFYDVDSLCNYIESGQYSLKLPDYKKKYVSVVAGPSDPEQKLLDRLDAIDVPEVGDFYFARPGARITEIVNRLAYGRAKSEYMRVKYGSPSYVDRFPGFSKYCDGHLIMSNDQIRGVT